MSNKPKIYRFPNMRKLVTRLRDDLTSGNQDYVLLYAYNGTGKTQLSIEFKEAGKRKAGRKPDTLYFNALTEDLFSWDNDLENDLEARLLVNSNSNLISGFSDLDISENIQEYFGKYCTARFEIIRYTPEEVVAMADPASPLHNLYRKFGNELETRPKHIRFTAANGDDGIKISRGEERIFIWSVFLSIFQQVLNKEGSYNWVKYLYIDDPVSSLDDNNAIAVACDLAKLLRKAKEHTQAVLDVGIGIANGERGESAPIKVVVSSHHALFFNVVFNELKNANGKNYFLHRPGGGTGYTLRATDDTPFFHHVALLSELQTAADLSSGKLYVYHFNMLRSILEKTAIFFGNTDFSDCVEDEKDKALFARALNFHSHGRLSLFEPVDMPDEDKQLFRRILEAFLAKHHKFDLPALLKETSRPATAPPTVLAAATPAPTP